jgi:hypothetical protein
MGFKKFIQYREAYPEIFETQGNPAVSKISISKHEPKSKMTMSVSKQPSRLKKMMSMETFDSQL